MHSKDQEESTKETSLESQSRAPSEMLPGTRKEKGQKKAVDRTVWERGISLKTEKGRNAEITVVLMLQARTKLSDNKVNGPEDAIVSEMIKRLPVEKISTIARCFQERFLGLMESPSSWKVVKLVFLKKPDAAGIRSYSAIALTSVM